MAFVWDTPEDRSRPWRLVDNDRDLTLRRVGCKPYNEADILHFYYNGSLVRVIATSNEHVPNRKKAREIVVQWSRFMIFLPPILHDKEEIIKATLKEALEAYKDGPLSENVLGVEVDFEGVQIFKPNQELNPDDDIRKS